MLFGNSLYDLRTGRKLWALSTEALYLGFENFELGI